MSKKHDIEKLISNIPIQQPSAELDDRIFQLSKRPSVSVEHLSQGHISQGHLSQGHGEASSAAGRRSIRMSHVVIGLAAMLSGILVGRWFPVEMNPVIPSNRRPAADAASTKSSQVPLIGSVPKLVDQGFAMVDGSPSRIYKFEPASEKSKVPVRKTIVVPSPEI